MYTVSEIVFTAVEGFIVICGFALLSNRKEFITKNKIKLISFVLIYTIYTFWLSLFIAIGFRTIIISILTMVALNYTFNSTLAKSIIKTLALTVSMSIVEIFISIFGLLITNNQMNELLKNNFYVFICSIITKIIELISIYILYRKSPNLYWLNNINPYQSKYKQVLIIISTVMFYLVFMNIYLLGNPERAYLFNIFNFVIYLVLVLAIVSAFREGSKLELLQYANEMQKENIQQLIDFNEMVAKERHEYKNHLNIIFGLCTLNKPDTNERIKHYINNYANNSSTKNISIDSGNDLVDAVINVKYNNGLRKGIELKANFEEPLPSADIQEDVAVTILSNIIENAFEAMNNFVKDNKFVFLRTYVQNDRYFISISNNGPMISEADKSKIFNIGYSTKDNPSKTRGFGLSIVQNEINRCNGSIEINSTPELTEFLVSFNLKQVQAAV